VTLTVTNSAGRTDQTTHDVTVTGSPPPMPVARLTVTSEGGYAGADGSASTAGQGANHSGRAAMTRGLAATLGSGGKTRVRSQNSGFCGNTRDCPVNFF
jgi:hypothetical protein